MPSFDVINYSLRPSKTIQRQLVFEGVRLLQQGLDLERLAYIGFGSIWFTDFVLAHKLLAVDDMASIEANEVGYKRALFNAPYATVRVKKGYSYEVLPALYDDEVFRARPWMIWLDYDYELEESITEDIRSVIVNAPINSVFLVTFNGIDHKYGKPNQRPKRLKDLMGAVISDDLPKDACKDDEMQETLANSVLDFMKSLGADLARPGGFVPAFRLIYRDGAPMVTVGGVLPAKGAAGTAAEIVRREGWPGRPATPIKAPHLTIREATVLQSTLPRAEALTREVVRALGFDLEDEQLDAFQRYYRQYPAFAQIIA